MNQISAPINRGVTKYAGLHCAIISQARSTWSHIRETITTQSYYAAGLVLQKGLPYLLIPLLVHLYGEHTYSSYVLFYTSTLMFANMLALAMPNAVIAFWYVEENKSDLSWTFLVLLSSSQFAIGIILALPAYLMYSKSFAGRQPVLLTLAGFLFAATYNFNTFLTGVCRARNSSRRYFMAQVSAGLVLLVGIFAMSRWPRLETLIGLFAASMALQDLWLAESILPYLRQVRPRINFRIARRVLAYAFPILPHAEAVVFCYWIDKYLVRQYFLTSDFNRFTISFQYAFVQAFFAQVFAMHTFPLICRLIADRDETKLRSVIASYNFLLALLGIAWVCAVLLLQYSGIRLNIDPVGFLLMGIAFMIWNIAGNYINTLWARFRTLAVTGVMIAASLLLVVVLTVGCSQHKLLICYSGHLISASAAAVGLALLERSQATRKPQSQLGLVEPVI